MATLIIAFITDLFTQLSEIPAPPNAQTNNVFDDLMPEDNAKVRNIFVTINGIIPNIMLHALNILDKRLIRSYAYKKHDGEDEESLLFVIQSTTIDKINDRHSNDSFEAGNDVYNVHLKTWNCTCPDFTMQVVSSLDDEGESTENARYTVNSNATHVNESIRDNDIGITVPEGDDKWFGGILRGREGSYGDESVPICKHLMACLLVSKVPNLFARYALQCTVQEGDEEGINEVAGWCAR